MRFKMAIRWLERNPGWFLWGTITYVLFSIVGYGFVAKELNPIGTGIGMSLWLIGTIPLIYNIWKNVKTKKYWTAFHEKYGKPWVRISVPFGMWCDFDAHFYLYDEDGNVKLSAKTEKEAVQKHEETGLYITRVIDTKP